MQRSIQPANSNVIADDARPQAMPATDSKRLK